MDTSSGQACRQSPLERENDRTSKREKERMTEQRKGRKRKGRGDEKEKERERTWANFRVTSRVVTYAATISVSMQVAIKIECRAISRRRKLLPPRCAVACTLPTRKVDLRFTGMRGTRPRHRMSLIPDTSALVYIASELCFFGKFLSNCFHESARYAQLEANDAIFVRAPFVSDSATRNLVSVPFF